MVATRAVKLTEKLFKFFTKILSKFELYSNLKGINSVREKIKFISRHFLADLRYTVHISVLFIWIKQINKVNVTM